MKVIIRTEWPETVVECLRMRGFSVLEQAGYTQLIIECSDEFYVEIASWLSDAIGCGLIMSGGIER